MQINFFQKWRSLLNFIFWTLRRLIRFRRAGYREFLPEPAVFSEEAARLNSFYDMDDVRQKLSAFNGARNLATLWYLEQMLGEQTLPLPVRLVEPGCQEFSRLPAWRAFLKTTSPTAPHIIGIEVDPFPILQDFHSRWDRAKYYISLESSEFKDDKKNAINPTAEYQAADFFKWQGRGNLIFCFYPFVSVAPALDWGLPAEFASAEKWIESFERVLDPGGLLLLIHQGPWEEEDFDRARENSKSSLQLEKRKILECPFFKTAHPMCASVYKKR